MNKLPIGPFLKDMKFANDELWSLYSNEFPYNLMYYDGTYITADCWNFLKAYIWSNGTAFHNKTVGQYYYSPNSDLGDWDGWTLLQHCTDISQDMTKIRPGELMYMTYGSERHVGVYYGIDNGRRKVFEFTPMWINGGFFTDIGPNGERSYEGNYLGQWKYHGVMSQWFDYADAYPTFDEGTKCIIKEGTKNYDTGENFASYVYSDPDKGVYYQLEVIQQTYDRVVLGHKSDGWILGPVNANDVVVFTVPEPPAVEPEPEPDPEPTPTPEPDPQDPEEEELSLLEKILETLKAILDFLKNVFKKEKSDD